MTLSVEHPYIHLLIAALRQRRMIVGMSAMAGLLTICIGLVLPRTYTAEATFFPRTRRPMAAVSGIAAQLGLSLPTSDVTEGPGFFEQLLRSRDVLDSVLLSKYSFDTDTGGVTSDLLGLYAVKGDSALRLLRGRKKLLAAMTTYIDYKSGLIALDVRASHPVLAHQVAQRLLVMLDTYNRKTRRGQATAERQSTEERLGEVRNELRNSEDRLQDFLERNREYRNSAPLAFQQERLQREVTLRQQVYTTLAQAYEQARIEEERDIPVLTVVQPPAPPEQPDGRHLAIKGIVGAFLAGIMGGLLVIGGIKRDEFRQREPDASGQLRTALRETAQDLRRPWRLFGGPR